MNGSGAPKTGGPHRRGGRLYAGIVIAAAVVLVLAIAAIKLFGGPLKTADGSSGYSEAQMKAYAALSIEFAKDKSGGELSEFEYGGGPLRTDSLVLSHTGEKLDIRGPEVLDLNSIGSFDVLYTLSVTAEDGKYVSREFRRRFVIRDTRAPVITLDREHVVLEQGDSWDPAENVISVEDPVDGALPRADALETGTYTVTGNVDQGVPGEYTVTVKARDKNNNDAETSFRITVQETAGTEAVGGWDLNYNGLPYQIRVNRAANTVTIYIADTDGKYTIPYKAMVCSTGGDQTNLGSFSISSYKPEWGYMYGDVYAQYVSQYDGDWLFHSVPYLQKDKSTQEVEEYNKLGSYASLGCVRLSVADAKWIYDNCAEGTSVIIYDDPGYPGPLGKPVPIHVDPEDPNAGWDPTDPDPANPWNN